MNSEESGKCNIYLYFCNIDHNPFLVTFSKYRLPTESIPNNFPTALQMKIILTVMISRYFWQCQKVDILLGLYSSTPTQTILYKGFEDILYCVFMEEKT